MKKVLFVFIAIMAIHQYIFGQNRERSVTIQTSPLLLFSDAFMDSGDSLFAMDLEGQFKLNKSSNISLTASFLAGKSTTEEYGHEERMYQINLKPMYIHRPFETGIKGFYLGFYPHFGFLYIKNEDDDPFYFEYGFGMSMGYKWVFRRGFTLQLGGAIGKTFSYPESEERYIPINSNGSITTGNTDIHILDFKLGYSF